MRKIFADKFCNKWLLLDKLDTSSNHVSVVDALANIRCIQKAAKDPYFGITLVEVCSSDVEFYDDGRVFFSTIRDSSFADAILLRNESYETVLINDSTPSSYLKCAEGKLATMPVLDTQEVVEVKIELLRKYYDDQLKDQLIEYMGKTYSNIRNFIDHKQAVGMNMDKEMFNTLQLLLLRSNIEPTYFVDGAFIPLQKIAERYMQLFFDNVRRTYKLLWKVRMASMRRRMIPLPGFDFGGKIGDHTKLFPLTKMRKMSVLWR